MPPTLRRRRPSSSAGEGSSKRARGSPGTLTDLGIVTSEDLVKALRGAETESLDKAEIARLAWDDEIVPVTRKRELLAEFVVSALVRDARSTQAECIADARYWKLLADVLSTGPVSMPGNVIGVLHSLGQVLLDGRASSDLAIASAAAIQHFGIYGASLEQTTATLEVWLQVLARCTVEDEMEACLPPLSLLVRSWTEGGRTKKHATLSQSFREPFCAAFAHLKQGTKRHAKLESCLCRLSMTALAVEEDVADLARIGQVESAAPIILEQICITTQKGGEDVAVRRQMVWDRAVVPFLALRGLGALHGLLTAVIKYKLYPTRTEPETALVDVLHHLVVQLDQKPAAAAQCVRAAHRIDERMFSRSTWTKIVARLQAGSEDLLTLICDSHSRSRTLDTMVGIQFSADNYIWTEQLDIALATQVSVDQASEILSTVRLKAGASGAALQLAARIVRALGPLDQSALKSLYDDVAAPLVTETGAAAYAMRLANAITSRAEGDVLMHIEQVQTAYMQDVPDVPVLQRELLLAVLERVRRKGDDHVSQRWLAAFLPNADETALDIIASAYLPALERTCSPELLSVLADKIDAEVKQAPNGSVALALAGNAANLELDRWTKFAAKTSRRWPDPVAEVEAADSIDDGLDRLGKGDYRPLTLLLCSGQAGKDGFGKTLGRLPPVDSAVTAIQAVVVSRPTLVRPREAAMLLAVFSQCLAPTTYAGIVASLIVLVRKRSATLLSLLPQLSVILCQLIGAFRWPKLGLNDARQLTRLFSAVAASKDLRQPFAVHAMPAVQSYVRAVTQIDFAIGEARQEVVRAMFCMCEMITALQRNVLMDFLADDGQRIVCRQLWRTYEAQRYRGG